MSLYTFICVTHSICAKLNVANIPLNYYLYKQIQATAPKYYITQLSFIETHIILMNFLTVKCKQNPEFFSNNLRELVNKLCTYEEDILRVGLSHEAVPEDVTVKNIRCGTSNYVQFFICHIFTCNHFKVTQLFKEDTVVSCPCYGTRLLIKVTRIQNQLQ